MMYTTQMDAARKGIVTPQMEAVAAEEQIPVQKLMEYVAAGTVAIPANKNHKCLKPHGIGSMLKTKINVNLGTSRDCVNLDEEMGGSEFEYLIADNYDPAKEIPDSFTTRTIPAHTWAVFPCIGRMPQALQGLNQQIFSQWLPTNPDYKIAAGINVEMYSDASKFEDGTQGQDYYCEVWIPVEKK